jgi:hypothetical protein
MLLGLAIAALIDIECREVVEAGGDIGMLGTVIFLHKSQYLLGIWYGFPVSALLF